MKETLHSISCYRCCTFGTSINERVIAHLAVHFAREIQGLTRTKEEGEFTHTHTHTHTHTKDEGGGVL
jgi:hypothetical protein